MSSSGSSGIDTFKASSIITVFLSIMVWSKAMLSLALTPVVLIIGYFIYNNYSKSVDNRSHDGSRSEADSSSTNAASSTRSNDSTQSVEASNGGGTAAKEAEERIDDTGDVAAVKEPPASKDVAGGGGGGGGGAELRKWKSKPINSREKDKSLAVSPPAEEAEVSTSTSSNVLKKSLSNSLGDSATPAAANTPATDVSTSNSDAASEVIPLMVNTPTPPPAITITAGTDLSRSRSSTSHTTDGVLVEDSDNELRKYVYLEILDTEDQYVKDLAIMKTLFMDPLLELSKKGKKALLDAAEIELIFSPNLTTMLSINSELLNNLKGLEVLRSLDLSKASTHEGPSFSEVVSRAFKKIMPFFSLYSIYFTGYETAIDKVNELRKSRKGFDAFLNERLSKPECRRLDLTSFLIKPVQRICKYPLFFKELLKHTPVDHVNYKSLQETEAIVKQIAAKVNSKMSEKLSIMRATDFGIELDPDGSLAIIQPYRRVLFESELYLSLNSKGRSKHGVIILTDVILLTQRALSRGNLRRKIEAAEILNASINEGKVSYEITFKVGADAKQVCEIYFNDKDDLNHFQSILVTVKSRRSPRQSIAGVSSS